MANSSRKTLMDISNIINQQQLIDYINLGNRVKYLYFWGHRQNQDGSVSKSCLSQWYVAPFQLDNIEYPTAEHYMMAEKARLFGDRQILAKIIAAASPGEAKKLGRLVNSFNQETWLKHRFSIVVRGNLGKFEQNQTVREFLINTNQRILVEASPRDRIWGIGLEQNHPQAANPHQWQGLNLLGFALMAVRNILQGSGQLADY
jgi:ribA/ribD-fused uncharacterized protein